MFRGPTHGNVMDMVGPMFSSLDVVGEVLGTGVAQGDPISVAVRKFVGLGNGVIVQMKTDLPNPTADTDVKWIDVSLDYSYTPSIGLTSTGRSRLLTSDEIAFAASMFINSMDVVSERDLRTDNAEILKHRWQVHRLPISNDTENQHPFGTDPSGFRRYPTIFDMAVADYLWLSMKFIAVDQNVAAVPTAGTTTEFAVVIGGHARSR